MLSVKDGLEGRDDLPAVQKERFRQSFAALHETYDLFEALVAKEIVGVMHLNLARENPQLIV